MRNKNTDIFLLLVIILLFLSFFFYTVEGFFNPNTINSIIHIKKQVPIDSVQIQFIGEYGDTPYANSWLNISDLTLLDKTLNKIKYWISPNEVRYTEGGDTDDGWVLANIWDDNPNTSCRSKEPHVDLIVNLNPPKEISSVQITNRHDGAQGAIRNYRVVLYNNGEEIGSKPLYQLTEARQTIIYTVTGSPVSDGNDGTNGTNGTNGGKGPIGDRGPVGPTGDRGQAGPQGVQGTIGPVGPGPTGLRGTPGANGTNGAKGDKGTKGDTGDKGDQGFTGYQGPRGETGIKGDHGDKGDQGDQGPQGISGKKGELGATGLEGVVGKSVR